jgi:hypothetical protein
MQRSHTKDTEERKRNCKEYGFSSRVGENKEVILEGESAKLASKGIQCCRGEMSL